MTPRYVDYYERYHARFSHFVEAQQVPISRAAADQLIANAQAEGKTMKAHCSLAIADVLQPVPPFETVTQELLPRGRCARTSPRSPACAPATSARSTSARTWTGNAARPRAPEPVASGRDPA